ncbi:MAG: hypothetical protein H7Y31_12525 [Chitinophagaceae bacterium]|nr:hypothetical protein [Chitinophagaceae bacterium]
MKQILVAAALLLSTFFTMANSSNEPIKDNVNPHIKQEFNKKFPSAQYTVWSNMSSEGLYIVRFVYHAETMIAYVDVDGGIIATARTIAIDKLPFTVNQTLIDEYSGFETRESMELVLHGELNYLFVVENAKVKLTVLINGSGMAREMKKEKVKTVNKL